MKDLFRGSLAGSTKLEPTQMKIFNIRVQIYPNLNLLQKKRTEKDKKEFRIQNSIFQKLKFLNECKKYFMRIYSKEVFKFLP